MIRSQSLYAWLSLTAAGLSFLFIVIIAASLPNEMESGESIPRPPVILIYLIYVLLICGIILSIISFRRGEKPVFIRWASFSLNLLMLFVIVAAIIYSLSFGR